MAAVPAIVACAGASAEVMLDEPFAAAAAGQACVFYDGESLLGGGWIMREEAETKAAE
jgi:tRNA-specific 2-thiouridylase